MAQPHRPSSLSASLSEGEQLATKIDQKHNYTATALQVGNIIHVLNLGDPTKLANAAKCS